MFASLNPLIFATVARYFGEVVRAWKVDIRHNSAQWVTPNPELLKRPTDCPLDGTLVFPPLAGRTNWPAFLPHGDVKC